MSLRRLDEPIDVIIAGALNLFAFGLLLFKTNFASTPFIGVWFCLWLSGMILGGYNDKLKQTMIEVWILWAILGLLFSPSEPVRYQVGDLVAGTSRSIPLLFILSQYWVVLLLRRYIALNKKEDWQWLPYGMQLFTFVLLFVLFIIGEISFFLSFFITLILIFIGYILNFYWVVSGENIISWPEIGLLYLGTLFLW